MLIARIPNATRVLGKSQGYLGLPIRDDLRAEYESLRGAGGRINRGARPALVAKYGLNSVHTLAAICAGRGYNERGGSK